MANDFSIPVRKAFEGIGPKNPIRKLNAEDRKTLCACLIIYSRGPRDEKAVDHPLERVSKLMVDAKKLATKLKSEVFQGPHAAVLKPFISGFEHLPSQLTDLSQRLEFLCNTVGKPGHKRRNIANLHLVKASEFVRLKLGQHFDEHLAELFQAVTAGWQALSEDLSGDAIRKKREYLEKRYPHLYADALNDIERISRRSIE